MKAWLALVLLAPAAHAASVPDSAVLEKLLANVTANGAVIAAPSRANPNYWYHWTRDAALVGRALVPLYAENTGSLKRKLQTAIDAILAFDRANQLTPNYSGDTGNFYAGYGEPRFNVNGTRDEDAGWCRPQNDGPALRALFALDYADVLAREGRDVNSLYQADPSRSLLKSDLEFIAHHWMDVHCSLWEDAYGHFFFTGLVQRRALLRGADLADRLLDPLAARYYREQAALLEKEILLHWYPQGGYIVNNLNSPNGLGDRVSNLDASVILAVIHADGADHFYSPAGDQVLATALRLKNAFAAQYPVNRIFRDEAGDTLGTAIGRYPEDTYDGHGNTGGNPWFLLTHAFAEFHFRLARELSSQGSLTVTVLSEGFYRDLGLDLQAGDTVRAGDASFPSVLASIRGRGDDYLHRSYFHSAPDGSMNEELRRDTGAMTGVPDLTWGYASLLTARRARGNTSAHGL